MTAEQKKTRVRIKIILNQKIKINNGQNAKKLGENQAFSFGIDDENFSLCLESFIIGVG